MARVLITGGAGFIGSNLAYRLGRQGHSVTVYDNLSRPGSSANVNWLTATLGANALVVEVGDVRDLQFLKRAIRGQEWLFHLAGQPAVSDSFRDPIGDAQQNILGTLNALEAAYSVGADPIFVFASTNKVYGALESLPIREDASRWVLDTLPYGVPETFALDCGSPYACSKAAAEMYVRDYGRRTGLKTVVFRQSCVYGPHQFGTEAQGWVAWFVRAAMFGRTFSLFGDGKYVRDLLWIDDLLDLYCRVPGGIEHCSGEVFNVGGGSAFSVSVWAELGRLLREFHLDPRPPMQKPPRPGDQRVYISDIRKAEARFCWRPRVSPREGLSRIIAWMRENSRELRLP